MLNHDQLQAAVAAANRQFDLIREKYPELKACLVMSSPDGQTAIGSSPAVILIEFPAMVVDDNIKDSALKLIPRQSYLTTGDKLGKLPKEFKELASGLHYHDNCQIEMRFTDLNYDLVWKLQADDLIDRSLTPQTKASIRVVLGTLSQFKMNI